MTSIRGPAAGVRGLHHVTAIAGDPQRNVDFYAGVLGLRLVKRTVNFDDPQTYHFYFGDDLGSPGSLMTFFPWPGSRRGRPGAGQPSVTSFAILPGAVGFWIERLLRHGVRFEGPSRRRNSETVLAFRDPDGLMLELVGHPAAESRPAWGGAPGIAGTYAIHGLHAVTLWVERWDETERVLVEILGFRGTVEEGTTRRYAVGHDGPGSLVDVRAIGGFGVGAEGAGTVHHVAFAVPDEAAELAVRARVVAGGMDPTPVVDRQYFRSVYFREPGGVLFELATAGPGFTVDEPADRLGKRLALPPQYEPHRATLEASLPPVHLPSRGDIEAFGGASDAGRSG